jgi:ssRNA-specific RNase YbeY (16S rRNA maturation enzyme)
LHLVGYMDKTEEEKKVMRAKEDEKIDMFHVKQ